MVPKHRTLREHALHPDGTVSNHPPDVPSGTVLADRYEVGDTVGSGGMSVVFAARDRRLGRPVAVKVIQVPADTGAGMEELRARFRREAAAAARIPPHPNVVQTFDYGTDAVLDLDFIVMELLTGEDLKARLAAGPIPPAAAVPLLLQAARGVAAGHRAGVVHRDIKPANLFLGKGPDGSTVTRVLDFGIAKPLQVLAEEDLTVVGHVPLSPAYASPEQRLRGQAKITPASDVYQLGLVAYEVLTGERPFSEPERQMLARGEAVDLPGRGRWSQMPPALRAVIEQALEPLPQGRFADAAAFAEMLASAATAPEAELAEGPLPPLLHEWSPIAEPNVGSEHAGMRRGSSGVRVRASARRGARLPLLRMAAGGLLLFLLLWGLSALLGGSDSDAPVAGDASEQALVEGAEGGQQEPREVRAPPTVARGGEDATEGVVLSTAAARAKTAALLKRAVVDLNQAWVEGDIKRHIGHYASRVDYYNSRRLARSGVRRDRARDLRRYDVNRSIRIGDQTIEFIENDRARVLVEKSWAFTSEDQTRTGRGIQEYIFKRDADDGKWYVVSEQLLDKRERNTVLPSPNR